MQGCIAGMQMDWISLLNSQQADFLQRLKKTKTNNLGISLLESQVKGCHSEVMAFWGETLTKLLEIARQKAEMVAKNPPPTPPEYPDTSESGISFTQYFQQQVQNYFVREQVVECMISQCWGKLLKKVSQDTLSKIKLDDE